MASFLLFTAQTVMGVDVALIRKRQRALAFPLTCPSPFLPAGPTLTHRFTLWNRYVHSCRNSVQVISVKH